MVVGVGERKEGFGRLLIEIKSAMYCTLYLFNGMVRQPQQGRILTYNVDVLYIKGAELQWPDLLSGDGR